LKNGRGTVAPSGVHLQIASQSLRPLRICGEKSARIGTGEKIAPERRRLCFYPGRFFDPCVKLLGNEWTDAVEFRQRTTCRDEITREFGPEERAASSAPKRADQNTGAGLRLSCKQFR